MDILDDMEVSKLSAKVFLKVNYSFKFSQQISSFYKYCNCSNIFTQRINGSATVTFGVDIRYGSSPSKQVFWLCFYDPQLIDQKNLIT